MDLEMAARIAQIVGSATAVIGLPLVLVQFRHRRAANFTAAWKAIEEQLQAPDVRTGRALCRKLNAANKTHLALEQFPDSAGWRSVVESLGTDLAVERLPELPADGRPFEMSAVRKLEGYVSAAHDAFDLAAILAWHARIPGLWYVVVSEWEDGIVNTWEAGAPLVKARELRARRELFECFSALYVTAVHQQTVGRGLYPYRGPVQAGWKSLSRWNIARRAKKSREDLLRRVQPGGHQSQ